MAPKTAVRAIDRVRWRQARRRRSVAAGLERSSDQHHGGIGRKLQPHARIPADWTRIQPVLVDGRSLHHKAVVEGDLVDRHVAKITDVEYFSGQTIHAAP